MNLDLHGKHALVCGASKGIGLATAKELASLGCNVLLLARDAKALAAARDSLPSGNQQSHRYLATDMGDADSLAKLLQAELEKQPVQIVINNSGGPPAGPAHLADNDAFEQAFRQHLVAAQTILKLALPGMRAADYGRIINIISTSVKQPIKGLGVSNTIRGAVASWAKTLATELGPEGITVNNVLPGFTATDRLDELFQGRAEKSGASFEQVRAAALAQVPMARFADPGETANAIAFLASPAAAYISGISLPVDGGRTDCL
jgi:3-oxoacyl-[acyl-carrier protein] reductase